MGLSSAGIGSNLDVEGIISKLMSVERQPLAKFAREEASYQAKLSGFGTLKGAISAFQSAAKGLSELGKFQGVKSSIGDGSIASVSASGTATPGTYSLLVSKLAKAQKLVADGTASDVAPIGKGVISFDFGTSGTGTFSSSGLGVKTVTIDDTNNSLQGIRDAINKAGIGVTASIVNDGGASPYRLALTSETTGLASSMKITVADTAPDTGLSALLTHDPTAGSLLTQTVEAQNAEFTVDGIAITKPSNKITDVINGVTLNLAKESATATNITVERDTGPITSAVNAFVKAYNDVTQNLRDATAYNPATKVAAVLNGEASVRTIHAQVRAVLVAPVAGGATTLSRLSDIGVTLQKDGSLSVDNNKLTTAINTKSTEIAGLFASVGKTTDTTVTYSASTADTVAGAYDVNITKIATQGSSTATAASGLTIGAGNDTLDVTLNGLTATIKLEQKTYTPAQLAAELQSKINGATEFSGESAGVVVTESAGVLKITSNRYGSASTAKITGGSGQAYLNFVGSTDVDGVDVEGTIGGHAATGSGQTLTGAKDSAVSGLAIAVVGGTVGSRGTVHFSRGYASQFDQLTSKLLSADAPLQARTDGLNASIKSVGKTREAMLERLDMTEKRYRTQFTALDLIISKMNTTSTYLAQQLAQISNLSSGS